MTSSAVTYADADWLEEDDTYSDCDRWLVYFAGRVLCQVCDLGGQ
jgi:hypothetical protein